MDESSYQTWPSRHTWRPVNHFYHWRQARVRRNRKGHWNKVLIEDNSKIWAGRLVPNTVLWNRVTGAVARETLLVASPGDHFLTISMPHTYAWILSQARGRVDWFMSRHIKHISHVSLFPGNWEDMCRPIVQKRPEYCAIVPLYFTC